MIYRQSLCFALIVACLVALVPMHLLAQFEYPEPVKPGVHPRLLFGPDDIPGIRRRAATPRGQAMLARLRRNVYGHRDANLKNLKKQDPQWLARTRQDIKRGLLSKWSRQTRNAAMLYTATGDMQDGWIGAEMFRLWLSTWPEPGKIEPKVSWGNAEMAMAYDMLYHLLTPDERRHAVAVFASMTAEPTLKSFFTEWSLDGPRISNRKSCNWTPIRTSSLGLTCQVIEGQPGYNPEIARLSLKLMKAFLLEGISADGGMFEGVIYPLGYGCDRTPYYITSTRRRGVDLTEDTHVLEAPKWFAYEALPWGYESQAFNKSTGQYGGGTFPTFLGQEAGAVGEWLFRNCRGWHPRQGSADEMMQLVGGIVHSRPVRPDHLPPSHWFSAVGRVVCRSGWGPRDAHVTFNTNPLGAGHTNADQGHFTFASHGVNFIPDSGVHDYASPSHNLVHIDGVGQSENEGALEAFIRFAELTDYADVVDADLKLAYDRLAVGPFNGPWNWVEYNPVQRADRRTLFVRGATGPLLVVTDDIKKDDQQREYDFLARTTRNNNLLVDGRSFTIAERFGGRYMHTVGPGKVATMVRDKIAGGTYRGWILVRGEPYPRQWSNTGVSINGKALPYNTTYFGLGNTDAGWYWNPILPKGPKTEPPFTLPEGKLEIRFESKTGGQVAAVVLTRDKDWQPGYALPDDGGDFVVLTMDDVVQGDDPWPVSHDPKSLLDGLFLGAEAPTLSIATTRQHVLHARRHVAGTRFACVMAPRDQDEGKTLQLDPAGTSQVAMVKREQAVDFVAASVDGKSTTGDVVTDAHAAVVSMDRLPQLRWMVGYVMAQGTTLSYRGGKLVSSSAPVTVVNDRTTVYVRGDGGTEVGCRPLDATRLVVNGSERAMPEAEKSMVTFTIPKRPDKWTVTISADGQVVRVTGDGPLPLVVKAPGAVRCLVNGVDRWFVKSSDGDIYPLLETGTT
ncbi:MAG: heparinase II/III domain-containing protein, partial [Planctomycetota bacterium]